MIYLEYFMEAIPDSLRHLPVYVTEINQNAAWFTVHKQAPARTGPGIVLVHVAYAVAVGFGALIRYPADRRLDCLALK